MMNHIKNWWYTHLSYIVWLVHFLAPSMSAWMDAHPKTIMSAIFALILARAAQVKLNGKTP